MKTKTIIAIVIAVIITIFSLQNSEITEVRFFFWKLTMSKVLIVLGSFAIGVLVGILVSMKKKISSIKK
jgi:lipopolysaccharide assembly protein A